MSNTKLQRLLAQLKYEPEVVEEETPPAQTTVFDILKMSERQLRLRDMLQELVNQNSQDQSKRF